MAHIVVFGAGDWGTALASVAASNGHRVCLWCRRASQARAIIATGRNPDYLPELALPSSVEATGSLAEAAVFGKRWIAAVPFQALREIWQHLKPLAPHDLRVCNAARGMEALTGLTGSDLCHEVIPGAVYSVLGGPAFPEDVAQGHATALVVASSLTEEALEWQVLLNTPDFRVFISRDVRGVEATMANSVTAIAAGMVRGLGMGDAAMTAIITLGMAEIARRSRNMKGVPGTVLGLAGAGDLWRFCTENSREFRMGVLLGQDRSPEDALAEIRHTVEGYHTARALAAQGCPLAQAVAQVLFNRGKPRAVLEDLLKDAPLGGDFTEEELQSMG